MNWFSRKSEEPPKPFGYRIYTSEYDVETTGDELIHQMSEQDRENWEQQIQQYKQATAVVQTTTALRSLEALEQIGELADKPVVSILIDHSGSLRGQRAIIACLLAETISDILERAGASYEILGFTTTEWRGGKSREKWIAEGMRKNPGRLNDLLHIIYKDAHSTYPGAPYSIYNLLRDDIIKENIDGEAILWAARRLSKLDASRKIMLVVSDGAPVDDSTLSENEPEILWNHIMEVTKDVSSRPGFSIAGIGIDYDVSSFYPNSIKIDRMSAIPKKLPIFIAELVNG